MKFKLSLLSFLGLSLFFINIKCKDREELEHELAAYKTEAATLNAAIVAAEGKSAETTAKNLEKRLAKVAKNIQDVEDKLSKTLKIN